MSFPSRQQHHFFLVLEALMKSILIVNSPEVAQSLSRKQTPPELLHRLLLLVLLTLLPLLAAAQAKDVIPFVECVKYTGNGKFQATFGYDNPNKKEVKVVEGNSYLTYEGTRPNGKPVSTFKAGRQSNAFSIEYDGKKVNWAIKLPNGKTVYVETSINAYACQSSSNISPYYNAPAGGKTNTKIGPELSSLFQTGSGSSSDAIFQLENNHVLLELYAQAGRASVLLTEATGLGLKDGVVSPFNNLSITGFFPIANLAALNALESLHFAQPVFTPTTSVGATTSQGDTAQGSALARLGFRVDGSGVSVGVLSDSYNAKRTTSADPAALDIVRGDLPAATAIQVLKDLAPGKGTDEGRAMMQIIHDVAPGATLAFRSGFFGTTDLALGIEELQAAGCQVIVDDITYITEPFLQDGIVAQAVNRVSLAETDAAKQVAYFSAAGNFGQKSYFSTFSSTAAPAGISGVAHNFGSGDKLQRIALSPGTYTIVLQWDDNFTSLRQGSGSQTDLDLYLADDTGRILYGFNRNNLGKDPVEVMPFIVSGDGAITNLMIINATNTAPLALKYIIFRGDAAIAEYATNSSTLVGQANAEGALAVGAVLYSNTPAYGVSTPTIASFSSRGGTPILRTIDGSPQNSVRNKPDIAAPNGGNTTVDLGGVNIDGDSFYNFFGTSAAAPHAAGLAALLIEAQQKYLGTKLSPSALKAKLQATALAMGAPGYDVESGAGFIQAAASLATIAPATPVVLGHRVLTGSTPNVEVGGGPYTIAIEGAFFAPGAVAYFNGTALETTFESSTEVTAVLSAVTGNYPLQVFIPAATPGTEGIYSDPYFFFSDPVITITAQDTVKAYGDQLPAFRAGITGIPMGMTAADFGLTSADLVFSASTADGQPVTAFTDAGDALYPISVAHAAGATGINGYTFNFVEGNLRIKKAALIVKARDTTLVYGAPLNGFSYDYLLNLNNEDPAVEAAIISEISNTHQAALSATALINAVALINDTEMVNGVPLINGVPLEDALANRSFLISAVALINAVPLINSETQVVQVNAVPLINALTDPAVLNAAPLINAVALINVAAITSGTALINSTTGSTSYSFSSTDVNGVPLINAVALINSTSGTNNNSGTIAIVTEADAASGTVAFNAIPLVTGLQAGTQFIAPGALLLNKNFTVSYKLGTITMLPQELSLTADDQYMDQGLSLPPLTATATGFAYGETLESLSGQITYNQTELLASSALPGTYPIVPDLSLNNYTVTITNGTLFVNPSGDGVKSVKPVFECVEPHPSKANTYIAHFGYQNDNNETFYIPAGPLNRIIDKASGQQISVAAQTTEFYPGTYSRQFSMEWNGMARVWELSSGGAVRNTSVSSDASAGSSRCPSATSPASSTSRMSEQATATTPEATSSSFRAYPNPVTDQVTVSLSGYEDAEVALTLCDLLGRVYIKSSKVYSDGQATFSMGRFDSGVYLLKIESKGTTRLLRIIKK